MKASFSSKMWLCFLLKISPSQDFWIIVQVIVDNLALTGDGSWMIFYKIKILKRGSKAYFKALKNYYFFYTKEKKTKFYDLDWRSIDPISSPLPLTTVLFWSLRLS